MIRIHISTRVVFLVARWAVKIPVDRRGWLQGLNERILWNQYKTKNCFAPLLFSVGGIVIQKRVEQFTGSVDEYAIKIKRQIPELNIANCDLHKWENWGWNDGDVVLLDYGITEQVSTMY